MVLCAVNFREQTPTEVLRDYMELLGVAIQVSVELLAVVGLLVELLLLLCYFFEGVVAHNAVPSALIAFNALLVVEGVAAHEVNCRQPKYLVAAIAVLLLEVKLLSRGF